MTHFLYFLTGLLFGGSLGALIMGALVAGRATDSAVLAETYRRALDAHVQSDRLWRAIRPKLRAPDDGARLLAEISEAVGR